MQDISGLKIAIFVDRDVTVRHFLDSNIFHKLAKNNELRLVFPPLNDKRISSHKNPQRFGIKYNFIKIPERRIQLWKWIFYTKIQSFKFGKDWKSLRKVYSISVGYKMKYLFKLAALPFLKELTIRVLKFIINQYKIEHLEDFVKSFKPDLLIHPSIFQGVFINELALISKEYNIPYFLLMNSWDNPCLKNTSIYKPTLVGVWGPQTQYHAIKYMGLEKERVKILGSAQFQCFKKNNKLSRDKILSTYGFNDKTTLILYAGSSKENDEFKHLLCLENICRSLNKNLRIIYRPHPWLSDIQTAKNILNYQSEIIKIDNTMINFMNMVIKGTINTFYSTNYEYTHDILNASNIVISPLSTILIEALCHGKEAICLIPKEEDIGKRFAYWKKLPCFQDVIKAPSIKTVEKLYELEEVIKKSYKVCKDAKNIKLNKENASFFVDMRGKSYEDRLQDCINQVFSTK